MFIYKGQIVNAHHRDMEGEAIAIELLRWTEGTFWIRPLREAPPCRITASTDSLLLQSCVSEDHHSSTKANTP
jgi:hypothetical protein